MPTQALTQNLFLEPSQEIFGMFCSSQYFSSSFLIKKKIKHLVKCIVWKLFRLCLVCFGNVGCLQSAMVVEEVKGEKGGKDTL